MNFTRREIHVLIVLGIFMLIGFAAYQILPARLVNNFFDKTEYISLLCGVAPLGFYIATDRERLDKK